MQKNHPNCIALWKWKIVKQALFLICRINYHQKRTKIEKKIEGRPITNVSTEQKLVNRIIMGSKKPSKASKLIESYNIHVKFQVTTNVQGS